MSPALKVCLPGLIPRTIGTFCTDRKISVNTGSETRMQPSSELLPLPDAPVSGCGSGCKVSDRFSVWEVVPTNTREKLHVEAAKVRRRV